MLTQLDGSGLWWWWCIGTPPGSTQEKHPREAQGLRNRPHGKVLRGAQGLRNRPEVKVARNEMAYAACNLGQARTKLALDN
mmetsp:Transcript_48587/g.128145  ORF Transcript_48587/g.128145 Transcript_48587/m.128145 type:complete len:81 (+) Transcript_48587:120-362(+)